MEMINKTSAFASMKRVKWGWVFFFKYVCQLCLRLVVFIRLYPIYIRSVKIENSFKTPYKKLCI